MDQYTPELLKGLEEIILEKSEEIFKDYLGGGDTWGSVSHPWGDLKFLSYIDYNPSLLLKVYSECLKKGTIRYGKYRRILNRIKGVKSGLTFEKLTYMLNLCKMLLMHKNRLPLHLNKGSLFERTIVMWRVMKGV